jgi:hypothetical protein
MECLTEQLTGTLKDARRRALAETLRNSKQVVIFVGTKTHLV